MEAEDCKTFFPFAYFLSKRNSRQVMESWICHTFIGFQRCTQFPKNIDLLLVHRSVRPSRYLFYSQNCLHILSKAFRSTAKHPTQEVGSIRCGSSRIHYNYYDNLNLLILTLSQALSPSIFHPLHDHS